MWPYGGTPLCSASRYSVPLCAVPEVPDGVIVTLTVADCPGWSSTAWLMAALPAAALVASCSKSPVALVTVLSNAAALTVSVSVAVPLALTSELNGPHSVGPTPQAPEVTQPSDGV